MPIQAPPGYPPPKSATAIASITAQLSETKLPKLLATHKAVKEALGYSNSIYWKKIREGEIEVVGTGRASRAVWASVLAYVARLQAEREDRLADPATRVARVGQRLLSDRARLKAERQAEAAKPPTRIKLSKPGRRKHRVKPGSHESLSP